MAKKTKKPASELTTDEALDRLFGKGAAVKIREILEAEEAKKPARGRPKRDAQ
jgi:hypothetical protein